MYSKYSRAMPSNHKEYPHNTNVGWNIGELYLKNNE